MKKLLILLFSLLFLSSSSVFADDISDFSIEGMSIGDSLLDYMTEDQILKEIEENKDHYPNLNEPYKYAEVYLFNDFPTYEYIKVFIKNNSSNQYLTNNNEKFTILAFAGGIDFIEDFDSCLQKQNEIVEVVPGMFPEAQKVEDNLVHGADPSGESIIDGVYFNFDSGAVIEVACYNFEETFRIKKNWSEGLIFSVYSEEIYSWLLNRWR